MLKIFGHPMSTCTRKVIMPLAETSTPYELSERPTWQKTAGRARSRQLDDEEGVATVEGQAASS